MAHLPGHIIDFHVHLFPDRLFNSIWKFFSTGYGWDVLYKLYYRDCVSYLRSHGVSSIVYSNYAHRKGIAKTLNEWNHRILDEIPDLYCFAAFHPDDDNALDIALKALEHPRVLGFKLQLLVQRFYPHDERLFPMYECVIKKHKRILLHVGTGPVGNEFVGLTHFKKLMSAFPELPVIVAHMGALEYDGFIGLLDEYPNLYFDTAFTFYPRYNTHLTITPELLERYSDRIVYGSDFPNLIFPREEEIDCLLGYNLQQIFYDRVFYENGAGLIERHSG